MNLAPCNTLRTLAALLSEADESASVVVTYVNARSEWKARLETPGGMPVFSADEDMQCLCGYGDTPGAALQRLEDVCSNPDHLEALASNDL